MNSHISVLNNQNNELNYELSNFVETDEKVRQSLNDRQLRISELRHRNGKPQ